MMFGSGLGEAIERSLVIAAAAAIDDDQAICYPSEPRIAPKAVPSASTVCGRTFSTSRGDAAWLNCWIGLGQFGDCHGASQALLFYDFRFGQTGGS